MARNYANIACERPLRQSFGSYLVCSKATTIMEAAIRSH